MKLTVKDIAIHRTAAPKEKPADESKLGFGNFFTDHMFLMDYDADNGACWQNPRIVPYGPLTMEPSAMCLHYAQEVFEGMKAYRTPAGEAVLFRPDKNMERLNLSNDRMCIPPIDEEFAVEAVRKLVELDNEWIPKGEGTSLYIRPFIIATEPHVGVHPARQLLFLIILSPVGPYYAEGINPVKIFVEQEYVRAVKGGTGNTKAGANYAASIKAQEKAGKMGYAQVLWLDGIERKYIEEVGTMNVFFKIDGEIVTPALQGSVLGGITRMSCIELLRDWGYKVSERRLSLEEVIEAANNGKLDEAFGTGTAAVISPIGELCVDGRSIEICGGKIGETASKLYNTLTDIQNGRAEDSYGWVVKI